MSAESSGRTGLVEISSSEAGEMEATQQVIWGTLMASISQYNPLDNMREEGYLLRAGRRSCTGRGRWGCLVERLCREGR